MDYQYYGTRAKASEVKGFIKHILESNQLVEQEGKRKTPVCIWGRHGIGKTEIVEGLAKELGWNFAYIAPAQFEEMGDLVGMPTIEDGRTVFRAPQWVPSEDGPGILLIDDVNRADDRILRGIMQLLQNYELISWKLPRNWHIILTANPDGGDYSVTPMDEAMLTRMMHITLEFEVKEWAKWAEAQGVDPRGINFVLTYPELVSGNRTTPRTLVQFFESTRNLEDLVMHLDLIQILGASTLDKETVSAFISYVNQNLAELVSPETILDSEDFEQEVVIPLKEVVLQETIRVDILAALLTRIAHYSARPDTELTSARIENLKRFIKLDFLPNDLRLSLIQDLVSGKRSELLALLADEDIASRLLG
ncbi:MAG: AAA family ATPase [Bacteroidia bacterium]